MSDQAAFPSSEQIIASAFKILSEDAFFKVGSAHIRGNDYRVFENAPATLPGVFQLGAMHGDREFLAFEDERWSFADILSESHRLADGLSAKCGVAQGQRVAIAMRNYPEWITSFIAIVSLGAVAVPMNAWWKTEELRYALADSGAKIVIADKRRAELLAPIAAELGMTVILARGDDQLAQTRFSQLTYKDVLGAARSRAAPAVKIEPDDDFAIYYTSGSTGKPKGVLLTHRGATTTLMSWAFLAAAIKDARGGVSPFGDNPGILLAIPLFHVTASHSIFLLSWIIGRRVVMMYKWAPDLAVSLIDKHGLTNFVGVPSQSYELLNAAGDKGLPTLIDVASGGAKRPPEHVRLLKKKFTQANPSSGYGLTETNALGCIISLGDYQANPDAAGRPVPPCCDIKVVSEGEDQPVEAVGEVWIRTAANFRGYLNLPDDTRNAITPEGWFRTGDLGKFDANGFLYIVDRMKDLIIRGGENISCLEVEERAYQYPAVDQAIAFSVPDDILGERVGLVVYAKSGVTLDPVALRNFMARELAEFKLPERIWLSPAPLPKLGTEKFDKQMIRRIALQNPPHWSA